MDSISLIGIAVALAMDAFAVALAAGLSLDAITGRHLFRLGFHFGLFQAGMPVLGWIAGMTVQRWIAAYDHWIAFVLLALVGGKMIREALHEGEAKAKRDPTRGWTMIMLSIATSIDALAVGITFAFLKTDIFLAVSMIGVVTFLLCLGAVAIGNRFGNRLQSKAGILGGVVLILIGLKILLSHLSIIPF